MLSQTLLTTFVSIQLLMLILWLLSLIRRDASVVDPLWGLGFVILAWIVAWLHGPASIRLELLVGLVTIWGLRLSMFLLWRNWGHGEDRRYAQMREHHGNRFWWVSLFTVFVLQGVILWFVAMPIPAAASSERSEPLGAFDVVGILAWSIGFFFESVGDWQLARFKANPNNAGRVMSRGLWGLTRHPNYFGDFCVWWGLYLIASGAGAWWTVASPILMSILLMRVSGVTLLERTISERRPEYAAYQARTNAFFPGWPRGESQSDRP